MEGKVRRVTWVLVLCMDETQLDPWVVMSMLDLSTNSQDYLLENP